MRGGDFSEVSSSSSSVAFSWASESASSPYRLSHVMMCRKPFVKDGVGFGCGQCLPCRLNKKRLWAHRLVLEGFEHADKAFATLTYEDGSLSYSISDDGEFLPTLVPDDLSDFLKRLRERVEPLRIRFYGVGEYGEKERPHFHVILYGYPSCLRGRTLRDAITGECDWRRCCINCNLIGEVWGKGIIELGEVNFESTSYIAEYVMKKWTSADDIRLRGRHPEMSRMSLKPGIGANAMHEVASELMRYGLEKRNITRLGHGKKLMPLGRYLSGKLRELTGGDKKAPPEVLALLKSELSVVRQAAFDCSASFSEMLSEVDKPKYDQLVALREIYRQRRVLK